MRATRSIPILTTAVAIALPAVAMAQVRIQTSTGDVVNFTQKNLVDHMIVGDSVEVEMAQLAASKTHNASVRDFANMLVTDHQAHLENLRKVAADDDVGRQPNPEDSAGAEAIRTLTSLRDIEPDSAFDREFIRAQIAHHTHELGSLKLMRGAAKDDELEEDLEHTLPVLERHLARAKQVAAELGLPTDTTGVIRTDTTQVRKDTTHTGVDTTGAATP